MTSRTDQPNEPEPTSPPRGVLRTLDASLNRATEGARVVEDYARFVLDDAALTERTKRLRHELAAAGATLPRDARLAARDASADVGAHLTLASEATRRDVAEVATASLERLQQALRSLEEFAKTFSAPLAARFEALRYEAYGIAKSLAVVRRAGERLAGRRLYVLVDGRASADDLAAFAAGLCVAGADVLQLRDKTLGDRELVERARTLVRVAREHDVLTIINDRPDIARLAGADGVHVGQDELSVRDARGVVGPDRFIGVSTHNAVQLGRAIADGADYVGLGPTFPTPTKRFETFAGLDYLREAAATTRLPGFAIGGVGPDNLADVLATGVTRIAVGSAVTGADDPAAAVGRLKAGLARGAEPIGAET